MIVFVCLFFGGVRFCCIWLFVFVLAVLLYVCCEIACLVYVFVCRCVVLPCLLLFVFVFVTAVCCVRGCLLVCLSVAVD